jgi:hypothetical protein
MSLITNFYQLSSLSQITAAQVEGNFAEFVKQLGGTYYSSGSPVVQSTGTLDASNFLPRAGIDNAYKNEPYSYLAINVGAYQLDYSGAGTVDYGIYFNTGVLPVSLYLEELRFGWVTASAGTPGAASTVSVMVDDTSVASGTIASQAACGALGAQSASISLAGYELKPGHQAWVKVHFAAWSVGGAQYIRDCTATIWAKALHVS